jgi:hypothetical protein
LGFAFFLAAICILLSDFLSSRQRKLTERVLSHNV